MANIHLEEFNGWLEGFKTNQVHVVCVAAGGLTTCDFLASTVGEMDQNKEVWPLTREVNLKGETGTFWPRFPLTVVPQFSWEGRGYPDDIDLFLERSFNDVVKANREYIKLDQLYVDLNSYCGSYDFEMAFRVAEKIFIDQEDIRDVYFMENGTKTRR